MELEQPGGLQPGPGVCRKRKRKSTSVLALKKPGNNGCKYVVCVI